MGSQRKQPVFKNCGSWALKKIVQVGQDDGQPHRVGCIIVTLLWCQLTKTPCVLMNGYLEILWLCTAQFYLKVIVPSSYNLLKGNCAQETIEVVCFAGGEGLYNTCMTIQCHYGGSAEVNCLNGRAWNTVFFFFPPLLIVLDLIQIVCLYK